MRRNTQYKLVEEFFLRGRPTVIVPPIRNFDAMLYKHVKDRIEKEDLTWREAFTQMALDWLKKK